MFCFPGKWQMKIMFEKEEWRNTSNAKKEKSMLQINHIWSRSQNNLRLTIFCWERCIMSRIEITSSNFGPIHITSFGIYAKLVISQLCIINKMKYDLHYPFQQFSSLISPNLKTTYVHLIIKERKTFSSFIITSKC